MSEDEHMNYSQLTNALNQASAFDLFRLRAAITRMLDDPQRIAEAKKHLRIGDVIEYFDNDENRPIKARLTKLQRVKATVENLHDGKTWIIPIYMINIHAVDTEIVEERSRGLGRNEVAIGDKIGFIGSRDRVERHGVVIRLNQKTVTLDCGDVQWRVPYSMLFKIVEQPEAEQPETEPAKKKKKKRRRRS
ncbi:MAG: hypothetical protein AAF639_38720 [Chloroflexota bacterium]